MNINAQIGKQIKAIRKRTGSTQEQLAEKAGISLNYITMIESGKRAPTVDTLNKIADGLGVKLRDLFSSDLPKPPISRHRTIVLTPDEVRQVLKTNQLLRRKLSKYKGP